MTLTVAFLISVVAFLVQNTGAIIQDFYWRDYTHGDIPLDAIEVGADGKYIGQVHVEKGLVTAMIYPHLHYAIYELFGKNTKYDHIKILCTPDKRRIYWEYVDFDKPIGNQMKNAILGGHYTNSPGHTFNVFIGKLNHENEWKVAKVISIEDPWKGLIVWDSNGKPVRVQQFHMLKYNSTVVLPNGCVFNG